MRLPGQSLTHGEAPHFTCYDVPKEGAHMSKRIELTDEQYEILKHAAAARHQTIDSLLAQLAEQMRDPHTTPHYFTEDEFLRHLGMTDEMIQQADALAAQDEGTGDADLSTTP
jgi:hypothetical protein